MGLVQQLLEEFYKMMCTNCLGKSQFGGLFVGLQETTVRKFFAKKGVMEPWLRTLALESGGPG